MSKRDMLNMETTKIFNYQEIEEKNLFILFFPKKFMIVNLRAEIIL